MLTFRFLSFEVDTSILMTIIMEHFSSLKHEIKSFGVCLMCSGVEINEYTFFENCHNQNYTEQSFGEFVLFLFFL